MKVEKLIKLHNLLKEKGVNVTNYNYISYLSNEKIDYILGSIHVERMLMLLIMYDFSFLSKHGEKYLLDIIDGIEDEEIFDVIKEAIDNHGQLGASFMDVIITLKDTKTVFGAKAVLKVAKDNNVRKAADFVDILKIVSEAPFEDTIDFVVSAATNSNILEEEGHLELIKGVVNASPEVAYAALEIAYNHWKFGVNRCLQLMKQLNTYTTLTSNQAYEAIRLIHNETLVNSENDNTLEAILGAACCAKGIEQTKAIVEVARDDHGKLLSSEDFIQYAVIIANASMTDDFGFGSNLARVAISLLTELKCDEKPLEYLRIICSSPSIHQAEMVQKFITSIESSNEHTLKLLKFLCSHEGYSYHIIEAEKMDKVRNSNYALNVAFAIAKTDPSTSAARDIINYLELSLEEENIDEEMVRMVNIISLMKNFQLPSTNIRSFLYQDSQLDHEVFIHLPRKHRDKYLEACSMAITSYQVTKINSLFNDTYNGIVRDALREGKTGIIDVMIEVPNYAVCLDEPIRFWDLYENDEDLAIELLEAAVKENPKEKDADVNYRFMVRRRTNNK